MLSRKRITASSVFAKADAVHNLSKRTDYHRQRIANRLVITDEAIARFVGEERKQSSYGADLAYASTSLANG